MSSKRGPPKHQNAQAWVPNRADKHNSQQKFIQQLPLANGVCGKCREVIEWKRKYGKYKPLKQPAKCLGCTERTVMLAYHQLCGPCAGARRVCAKCMQHPAAATEQPAADDELDAALARMTERQRRTAQRQIVKGTWGEAQQPRGKGAAGENEGAQSACPTEAAALVGGGEKEGEESSDAPVSAGGVRQQPEPPQQEGQPLAREGPAARKAAAPANAGNDSGCCEPVSAADALAAAETIGGRSLVSTVGLEAEGASTGVLGRGARADADHKVSGGLERVEVDFDAFFDAALRDGLLTEAQYDEMTDQLATGLRSESELLGAWRHLQPGAPASSTIVDSRDAL